MLSLLAVALTATAAGAQCRAVGDDSRIGANAVLLRSVDDHSVVVGVPGQIIASRRKSTSAPTKDPDPVHAALQSLLSRVATLEEHVSGRVEPTSLYLNAAGDWESSDFAI